MTGTHIEIAHSNLGLLKANSYPGRGLVLGRSQDGNHLAQIYWIMGRGDSSRNRVFSLDGGRLFTEPADPSKIKDPAETALTIYDAMLENEGYYVVSNGAHTRDIAVGGYPDVCLHGFQYEPDGPNFTPRIAGAISLKSKVRPIAEIAILRKSPWDDSCERIFHRYAALAAGFGHCITTYMGNGSPLPSFRGEPLLVPLIGDASDLMHSFWAALNEENRVSLAVKLIDIETGVSETKIVNKYQKT